MLVRIMLSVCALALCAIGASAEDGNVAQDKQELAAAIEGLKAKALDVHEVRALAIKDGWNVYEGNPVVGCGAAGTWDAGALGSMTVLRVGGVYHMYYESWGVRSEKAWDADEYESLQIGHAVSLDGVTWVKDPANPVLRRGAEGEWDRTGTWDPYVIFEEGKFKMWYGGGGGGKPCDWAYAESEDGQHFVKKGRISEIEEVEDDHVVHDLDAEKYYMYFWDRRFEPNGLFRVESANETDFDFDDATSIKIAGVPQEEKFKFTHVIREEGAWYMFFGDFVRPHCPNSVVRLATSTDGLNWTARNEGMLEGHDAEILKVADDLYLMYFGPRNHFDAKDCDIRLGVYAGSIEDLLDK